MLNLSMDNSLYEAKQLFCLPSFMTKQLENQRPNTSGKKQKNSSKPKQRSLTILDFGIKSKVDNPLEEVTYRTPQKKKKSNKQLYKRIESNYLYNRSINNYNRKSQRRSRASLQKEQEELSQCSFHPVINDRNSAKSISSTTDSVKRKSATYESGRNKFGTYENLYKNALAKKQNLDAERSKKEAKVTEGLTFFPKTNLVSTILDRKRIFE